MEVMEFDKDQVKQFIVNWFEDFTLWIFQLFQMKGAGCR